MGGVWWGEGHALQLLELKFLELTLFKLRFFSISTAQRGHLPRAV